MRKGNSLICPNCGQLNDIFACEVRQRNSTPNITPSLTDPVDWKCKYCDIWFEAGTETEVSY